MASMRTGSMALCKATGLEHSAIRMSAIYILLVGLRTPPVMLLTAVYRREGPMQRSCEQVELEVLLIIFVIFCASREQLGARPAAV
mmetsp:Transcript_71847/g.159778  ORF Transcript_71847/g.159778 Transcript_71847/m.159778 type:complete len:86 (+) Transcript_71847:120-377(+)